VFCYARGRVCFVMLGDGCVLCKGRKRSNSNSEG